MNSGVIEPFCPSIGLLYRLVLPTFGHMMIVVTGEQAPLPELEGFGFRSLISCRGTFSKRQLNPDPPPWRTVFASALQLPFLQNSLDCVVLQNAFEISASKSTAPKSSQPSPLLLRALREVLISDGILLLPTRNILAPRNFLEGIAKLLSRKPIFMRSYFGYMALLKAGGFHDIVAYCVMPSHDQPREMVSCRFYPARTYFLQEASAPHNRLLVYVAKWILAWCGVAPYIQYNFLFVCRK